MKIKQLSLIIILLLLLAACGGATTESASDGKITAVSTIGMVTDIVENIGGDHVNAIGLMGPGTDPHLYVASAGDVTKLSDADVIFYNGLFLESQMEEVLEQLSENKTVVPITKGLDTAQLLASPDYDDEFDPHVWFYVPFWQEAAIQVRDTLIEIDPDNQADYEANADAYLEELDALHAYVEEQTARVPDAQRVLVTAHDAFSYFGHFYGFDVLGLQGISTESEASTDDVQNLADFIVENQIPAIFIESSVPVRTIEAVQAAVQDQGFDVEIGGELFSDAMGDTGSSAGTYQGMVRHNVDTIVGALLGE